MSVLLRLRQAGMFFLLTASCLNAQNVQEKLIAEFPQEGNVSANSIKYDAKNGTYVYSVYDSVKDNYTLLSNKGNSDWYSYADVWTVLFDDDGNYFASVYNKINDTTFHYYLLLNGEIVTEFDNILSGWAFKNGTLYFPAQQNGRYYFISYDAAERKITAGKPYDAIELVFFREMPYEGEPMGEVGFTKDGKPYYLAVLGDEEFLVIGGEEQKHYADIESFYIVPDKNGELTYFAKNHGKFYQQKGHAFVVQGRKEYDEFDYVHGPILFDNANNPVYISGDSVGNYRYPERVMVGNNPGKTYEGGISDLKISPSGKLAYFGYVSVGEDKTKTMLVVDGKEGKKYDYTMMLSFDTSGKPLYVASRGGDKYFVLWGNQEFDSEYQSIMDLKVVQGKLVYIGANYGDYEKKIPDKYYIHVGEKVKGPYNGVQMLDYGNGSYLSFDSKGNYCYTASGLIDFDNYLYKQRVFVNEWKSNEFDFIPNVNLYQGKAVYNAGNIIDREAYTYKYKIYLGDKEISPEYDDIVDYTFYDRGIISFVGLRDKRFYWVEVKLQ